MEDRDVILEFVKVVGFMVQSREQLGCQMAGCRVLRGLLEANCLIDVLISRACNAPLEVVT